MGISEEGFSLMVPFEEFMQSNPDILLLKGKDPTILISRGNSILLDYPGQPIPVQLDNGKRKVHICNEETDFFVVKEDVSAVFYSLDEKTSMYSLIFTLCSWMTIIICQIFLSLSYLL
jgi:hypothetical protein